MTRNVSGTMQFHTASRSGGTLTDVYYAGCSDDDFPWEREGEPLENKYFYTTHSELNAILNYRGGSLEGATIYVTLFPCNECAKAIIQSGIRRIVYDSDKYETTPSVVASKKMLKAAGVVLQRYEHTNRRIELEL